MTIAWITGGGTGIGRALADRLLREGSKVIISGRRRDILDQAVKDLSSLPGGGEVLAIAGDASDPAHSMDVISQAKVRWGDITLLVNNAGSNSTHELLETTFEEYLKSFKINCLSSINCTQSVLPLMVKAGRGTIVNISSIYGKWASSSSASYSVGKYAVAGYTDALRQALVGTPVHILGVYPGFIQTDMTMPFVVPGSMKSRMGKTPDQIARVILNALKRKKSELYYPWYVPWVLRLHRWFPQTSDRLARRIKR
jgi:3-oxoacyl-[acyl-carrier protein] reductase